MKTAGSSRDDADSRPPAVEVEPGPSGDAAGAPADAWLVRRLEEIPSDLALAVRRLVGREPGLTPDRMATASLDAFDRVAAGGDDRDRALELLAADALLTYAFEAAADPALEGSAAGASALADRFGPSGELGRRSARTTE